MSSTGKLQRQHAAYHTIWDRLSQGLKQGDWTKEKVKRAHDEVARKLVDRGIKHESPIETGRPDKSSHTRFEIEAMPDDVLLRFHANLHSLWSKMQEGLVNTGWTEDQLVVEHEVVVAQLIGRGYEHNSPLV